MRVLAHRGNVTVWYQGALGIRSKCALETNKFKDGKVVCIVTELHDNPGTSVTNCAEELLEECLRSTGVNAEDLCYIEHYPGGQDFALAEGTYDLAKFRFDNGRPYDPWWEAIRGDIAAYRSGAKFESCVQTSAPVEEV